MSLTIYTLWADRIIAGTHKLRQVPPFFQPGVRQILESRKYLIQKDGTVVKKSKHGG